MDFDHYVAARRSRLIEDAVRDGVPVAEADELVDVVLDSHRRDIAKAEDPHPLMQAAVARAARGEKVSAGRSPLRLLPVGALGLIVLIVLVVSFVGRGDSGGKATPTPTAQPTAQPTSQPTSQPSDSPSDQQTGQLITTMPLLLGYDDKQAQEQLRELGLRPADLMQASCAPFGLVLGSKPKVGTPLKTGDSVTLLTAAAETPTATVQNCDPTARGQLASAWEFVRYMIGRGVAPAFAPKVTLVIDGGAPARITGADAGKDAFGGLAQYFQDFTGINGVAADGRYPELTAIQQVPAPVHCGIARPPVFGTRQALSVSLESYTLGDDDTCALTVDLYRSGGGLIDGVVLYREPSVPSG